MSIHVAGKIASAAAVGTALGVTMVACSKVETGDGKTRSPGSIDKQEGSFILGATAGAAVFGASGGVLYGAFTAGFNAKTIAYGAAMGAALVGGWAAGAITSASLRV